jgi:hypothetical protein
VDYANDGVLVLKMTDSAHRRLDEYFEKAKWHVSMSQPEPDTDGKQP